MRAFASASAVLAAFVLLVPSGCVRGPLDGVPTLSVGPLPDVQKPQVGQKFHQAAVLGHTYSLPCPGSVFIDKGWVPRSEDIRPVAAHDTARVELVMDGMRLWLGLQNDGDRPVPWEQAQVVGISTYWGVPGPTPQLQPRMTKDDVVALLGTPDLEVLDRDGYPEEIAYYGLPVQTARLVDAGLEPADRDDGGVTDVGDVSLVLGFFEGRYGSYELYSDIDDPFDPEEKSTDELQCLFSSGQHAYSYRLHTDFFLGPSTRPAGYVVDGQAYVFGVSGSGWCEGIDPDKSFAQKVDDDLLTPLSSRTGSSSTPEPGLSGPGEPFLLWDRKDSSAAVLVFRGKGERTGDDFVQVWLNYCDWESGLRVSLFFSMISVEPGVAVSEDAENYLLSMVSDVAESVTRTR